MWFSEPLCKNIFYMMLCSILETMICNIVPDIIMKHDCLRLPLRVLKFKVDPHSLSGVGFVDVMIPCEFGRKDNILGVT